MAVSTAVRVERVSPTDRAFLAMDTGPVPEQFGVLLRLGDARALDLDETRRLLADRVTALPRLRQRLVRTPFGCGGPVWVDDPDFAVGHHIEELRCEPGDEAALVEAALAFVLQPLPRDRPLWRVGLLTGNSHERALVVVLHHTLADGMAGLAVLAGLVDEGAQHRADPFPRPRPSTGVLARDAWRERVRAARSLLRSIRLLRRSFTGAGGLHPPRVAPCSLVQQTGPCRRAAVVRTDLDALSRAAHALDASTNDAVLVAVARALGRVLRSRGEDVQELTMAVPVAGRRDAGPEELGNMVSPVIVAVPTAGPVPDAVRAVAAAVRQQKSLATGPPPIALLGWAFRPLARAGGYRWYMNHQHRLHTLVSHLRGPRTLLTFAGHPIVDAVPLAVAEGGNVPVYFEVLSYAGTLTISVVADPDHFAELDLLTGFLEEELRAFASVSSRSETTRP